MSHQAQEPSPSANDGANDESSFAAYVEDMMIDHVSSGDDFSNDEDDLPDLEEVGTPDLASNTSTAALQRASSSPSLSMGLPQTYEPIQRERSQDDGSGTATATLRAASSGQEGYIWFGNVCFRSGNNSLPSLLNDGDLDGDMHFTCWESHQTYEPIQRERSQDDGSGTATATLRAASSGQEGCIWFGNVRFRSGNNSLPPLLNDGDLDGDMHFICWDTDIAPDDHSDWQSHRERSQDDGSGTATLRAASSGQEGYIWFGNVGFRLGNNSLPPLLNDGDLDGDMHFTCWDTDIAPDDHSG